MSLDDEAGEKVKQSFMLRDTTGTPLSSYYDVINTSVWSRAKEEKKSFTPMFDTNLEEGTIILLTGSMGENAYFEVTQPEKNQGKPFSIHARRIPKEEVEGKNVTPVVPAPPKR